MIIDLIEQIVRQGYDGLIFGSSFNPLGFKRASGGSLVPIDYNLKDDAADIAVSQLLNPDQYQQLEEDGQVIGHLNLKQEFIVKFNVTLIEGDLVAVLEARSIKNSGKVINLDDLFQTLSASVEAKNLTYLACTSPIANQVLSSVNKLADSSSQLILVSATNDNADKIGNYISIKLNDENVDKMVNMFSEEPFQSSLFVIDLELINRPILDFIYQLSLNESKVILISRDDNLRVAKNKITSIEDRADVIVSDVIICSERNNVENDTILIIQTIKKKTLGQNRRNNLVCFSDSNLGSILAKLKDGSLKIDSRELIAELSDGLSTEYTLEILG